MKYDFDSYLLYEVTSSSLYTAKVVVELIFPFTGRSSEKLRRKLFGGFRIIPGQSGEMSRALLSWNRAKNRSVFLKKGIR